MAGKRLRARDRRALLLGAALTLPVALFQLGVAPWLERVRELRSSLEAERGAWARERGVLEAADRLTSEHAAVRATVQAARPRLLEGKDALGAGTDLTRRVTEAARGASVLLQDVQSLERAAPEVSALGTAAVRVRILGDLEGILLLLHEIEHLPVLVSVDELDLHAAGINDGDLERGQLLSLTMVVSGAWWRGDGA